MWRGGRWRGARDHLEVRRDTDAWQGPHGRVHAADREGRHVACEGFASGRPTGIVGPGNIGGTVTLWWRWELPYLTVTSPSISSVWDYVPTRFLFCKWRGDTAHVGSHGEDVDRVDLSPRDLHQSTCLKKGLSNNPDGRHVAERGSTDLHRTAAIFFVSGSSVQSPDLHRTVEISIASYTDRTADGGRSLRSKPTRSHDRDCPLTWSAIGRLWRHVEELHDHGPIEPRSQKFRRGIVATGSDGGWLLTSTTIDARSWPDRCPIVAKMVANRKLFWSKIVADSKPIRKLRLCQGKPPPRRINSAPTIASIGHDLRTNFPL